MDDAPAVVDQASNFTTSEVGCSPVRLVRLIARADKPTRPLGVTKQEQQDMSSSFWSKV